MQTTEYNIFPFIYGCYASILESWILNFWVFLVQIFYMYKLYKQSILFGIHRYAISFFSLPFIFFSLWFPFSFLLSIKIVQRQMMWYNIRKYTHTHRALSPMHTNFYLCLSPHPGWTVCFCICEIMSSSWSGLSFHTTYK